jgi:Tol biopolymer transport system component
MLTNRGVDRAGACSTGQVLSVRRVLMAVAVAAVAAPGPASAAPEHAEIAFVHGSGIWAARADGSERRMLVEPTRRRQTLGVPAWSPDGSALAYVSHLEGPGTKQGGSHLMVFDGTASRALTPLRKGVFDVSPAWSPDGSTLAFARATLTGRRWRSEIVTRVVASGAERTLVRLRLGSRFEQVAEPAWSPDGATVAYTRAVLDSEHAFRPSIRVVPAAGGESRTLIREAQSPAWSPDGGRLALVSVRDRNGKRCESHECSWAGEIYTAAADGTGLRRLTANEGDDVHPTWSADGSRILFSSDRNLPERDSSEVYSIAADRSCLTWLTNGTPASGQPAWRPGSGTRFDPGSCDPASRVAVVGNRPPPGTEGGLWLGPRFGGRVLSATPPEGRHRHLGYDDCERFTRCPDALLIHHEHVCETRTFRIVTGTTYRLLKRRGAILAYYGPEANAVVFSGTALTAIRIEGRSRLTDVDRIVRGLRPLQSARPVSRLAPPRVPRTLTRVLERTARAAESHGGVEQTARALGIDRFEVEGRLRTRRALRSLGPYRYAACSSSRSR